MGHDIQEQIESDFATIRTALRVMNCRDGWVESPCERQRMEAFTALDRIEKEMGPMIEEKQRVERIRQFIHEHGVDDSR